eukprot:GHUV01018723.1.p1 GENE.GHUV01018723.1~~GHUV01018723.1.p1  ORF type:complete len:123 (-),score=39.94 GHUV01018723.1:893-1261(-)
MHHCCRRLRCSHNCSCNNTTNPAYEYNAKAAQKSPLHAASPSTYTSAKSDEVKNQDVQRDQQRDQQLTTQLSRWKGCQNQRGLTLLRLQQQLPQLMLLLLPPLLLLLEVLIVIASPFLLSRY